jgi:lipoprotein-anchoring transpeptidase ErfK/SrfK
MKQLAIALALAGTCALSILPTQATALETFEARVAATDASMQAREDMIEAFGPKQLKPGQYVWRDLPGNGDERVVVSLGDQMAYLYRGSVLVAASTISTGKDGHPTPPGIFSVLQKQELAHSRKYDNAPMPFMQRIDNYGIALHAGFNPGKPASHGCVRLPKEFAKKLYSVTELGTPVLIGA